MKRAVIVAVAVMSLLVSGCATGRGANRQMSGMVHSGRAADQSAQQQYVVNQYAAPPQPAPQVVAAVQPPEVRKYLNIGANPVDPKRPTRPHERVFSLAEDAYVVTKDHTGKVVEGWLKAGEQVFAVPSSDPRYWEATFIKKCGNPIMNRVSGIAPIWIFDPAVQQQQPVVQHLVAPQAMVQQQPVILDPSEPVPCRERKSGWGSVIGGGVGFAVGLLTRKPVLAAATAAAGSLFGGYLDGECIDPQDAAVAVGWGIAGYGLTKPRSHNPTPAGTSFGPAPLPSN